MPLKFSAGVYKTPSSLGLLGVLLLFIVKVPSLLEVAEINEIAPMLAPSPPKESLFKTLI